MDLILTWPAAFGLAAVFYGTLAVYRLFLHPLAKFPGPRLAALSRWYEAYYDVILGGQYTSKIAELHKLYGPIIRISPYELHVIDPAFYEVIYRTDGRWDKYSWTYDAFGAKGSTVFASDHNLHKARRRAIAPYFSRTNVAARHDLVRLNIVKLSQRIVGFAGSTFNLGAAISAFTRDNANEYIIGKAYRELDLDDFGIGLSMASQGAGVFWRTTKHVRWFGPALKAMPVDWAMKLADEGTKSFLLFLQQSERDTLDALAAAKSHPDDDKAQNTMVSPIVRSDLPPAEKLPDRVFDEVATVTGAGYETIANTLRLILYHIYSNDEILRRLRNEIASVATKHPSEPVPLRELERMPYLTAVLTEGLRLSPGLASRAARVAYQDLVYGEWRIPAGTPVGMTTLLMHTDEKVYPDPMLFDPDRWVGQVMTPPGFAPFSRGTRVCLGMHLAWAEMYLIVAALVQQFTFRIKDAEAGDFELIKDNFGIGTKAGCNLMAYTVSHEA